MDKSELQELYQKVKSQKSKRKSKTSLIEPKQLTHSGCRTCGKVTWKPY